jgi:hypothetical protein
MGTPADYSTASVESSGVLVDEIIGEHSPGCSCRRYLRIVVHDLIPAMALLRSLVYLFASLTVTVFFYVFDREGS